MNSRKHGDRSTTCKMRKSPINNDMFCCPFARKALIIVVVFVLILVTSDSFADGSNVYNNNHANVRSLQMSKVFLQRQILEYRCGHQYNEDSNMSKATMPPRYRPPSTTPIYPPPPPKSQDGNAENLNNNISHRKISIQNEVRRVQDKQPVENDIEQYSYASPAKVRYQSKYYSANSTMRRTGLSTTSSHWKSDENKGPLPPPPPPPLYMEGESKVTEKIELSTTPVVVLDDQGDNSQPSLSLEMMKDCENREYISNLTSTEISHCSEDDKTFGTLDLEEAELSKYDFIEESKQDSKAMSKLQDSILQKANIGKAQETTSLSSTIMNGLSAVGRQLVRQVFSSVRISQDGDHGKRNILSDSMKPKFVIGDGDTSWSNVSIIQSDFDLLIETKTKPSNDKESDSIWTSEERLLEQTVDLFSLYFDLWKIKSTFAVNRKQTKQEKSRNMNAPIPIQDSHLAFAIDHRDIILVSAFFNSAITKALVNEILFSSILPAVHSRIDNQRPPKKITVTRREKKVVTKTTRTRPTILSRINTDKDLDDIDFARLLVELESCNDEEVIEEHDFEYDAEPIVEEYQYDEITDNEVTNEDDDYPEVEALSESDFEDDLLDDNDLEILEAAMLDSSSWFSEFFDESDSSC